MDALRAVGFVCSWSRLAAIFTGFVIAVCFHDGIGAVAFTFIGNLMAGLIAVVIAIRPRTTGPRLEAISRQRAIVRRGTVQCTNGPGDQYFVAPPSPVFACRAIRANLPATTWGAGVS